MAEVGKHPSGDVRIDLTPEEAQRLLDLLYVVEDGGEYALYAQLQDIGFHSALEFTDKTFHPVDAQSVQIVSSETTEWYVKAIRNGLPEGASLQVTQGSGNTVLNITVPR